MGKIRLRDDFGHVVAIDPRCFTQMAVTPGTGSVQFWAYEEALGTLRFGPDCVEESVDAILQRMKSAGIQMVRVRCGEEHVFLGRDAAQDVEVAGLLDGEEERADFDHALSVCRRMKRQGLNSP